MSNRLERIAEEIKRIVSDIIRNELHDPRISALISVTHVKVTKDLKFAKVYVSILGNEKQKTDCITGLKSASGFIRREVGQRIQIRNTPEVHFELDESIEQGAYITELIKKTVKSKDATND